MTKNLAMHSNWCKVKGSANIFYKGPDNKYFDFVDYVDSVTAIQFCSHSAKTANIYVNDHDCVPKTNHLHWIWTMGHNLTP